MRRAILIWAALLLLPGLALADYQIRLPAGDLGVWPDLPEEVFNILLIGTDSWEDVYDSGRSDTVIVCSLNRETGGVRLVSVARDLLVNIPAGGGRNRLNAAHSFGGPALLMKTVNQTFHLNVTRYASLNIYGLRRIIDAVGGLPIRITQEEARRVHRMIGIEFPREKNPDCPYGSCVLSGLQAMTYARIRDLDNDFGRMNRQQKVLRAIGNLLLEMDAATLEAFIRSAMMQVSTNLGVTEILDAGRAILSHGIPEVRTDILPARGSYVYENLDGMSVLLSEEEALQRDMHELLYGL